MLKSISKLLGSTGSSTELAAALESAQADLVVADAAVTAANEAYESNLLDDTPEESKKRFEAKTDAGIAVDRAAAIIRSIEKRLAAAVESEAAAHRADLVAVAKKKSAAARKRLQAEYPAACEQIRSLLRELAESEQAVLDANGAALEGERHLPRVEEFRDLPTQFREEVTSRREVLWAPSADTSQPLTRELQRRVTVDGKRASVRTEGGGSIAVEQCMFDVKEYLPHESGTHATPLAKAIELPGLGPLEGCFWSPLAHAEPYAVLRQIDERRRPAATVQPRDPIVEYRRVRG